MRSLEEIRKLNAPLASLQVSPGFGKVEIETDDDFDLIALQTRATVAIAEYTPLESFSVTIKDGRLLVEADDIDDTLEVTNLVIGALRRANFAVNEEE